MRSRRRIVAIAGVALALLICVTLATGSAFLAYQAESVRLQTPQGILEELPVYPQAQNVKIIDRSSLSPILTYKVNAKAGDVLAFYGNWFSQRGWRDVTPATSHYSLWVAGEKRIRTMQLRGDFPWIDFEERSIHISLIIAAYTVDVGGTDGADVIVRPPQISQYDIIY